ncbi:hypothetical protein MKW94_010454 [Papaver nudicaule]|uniref:S-protein homolog n=1 Tax=Papaver nudicaule TaxID=74823 RepID=A0AA41S5V6_PAPNU|nr:hypothetical protein [Papaver nudicaule]
MTTSAFILSVVVIFSVLVSECSSSRVQPDSWGRFDKTHVYLRNEISEKVVFHNHCYSSETDFGDHSLTYGQEFTWSFRVNFWASTKYWCDMWFDTEEGVHIKGGFHVYKAQRDSDLCSNNCHYSARRDGVYLLRNPEIRRGNGTVSYELLYKWP